MEKRKHLYWIACLAHCFDLCLEDIVYKPLVKMLRLTDGEEKLAMGFIYEALLLFRDKHETFGTPQVQRAWKQMNPIEWWMIYDTCVLELQKLVIKVLSETTFASNYECNWSKFSYIHTKARNGLKF
ncbi:uncharacterized protein LOC111288968 [Durio zibethinus]|uniref:Uncharacterized protein LOC111288968 n=1 Tax=Durio zibethinus TaxID=66656 RepID=A0A6P5Y5C3_DURZI|nr:uncharacterized protein LOC111288968 [Durio zibethinus]